jgi:hypothetical protein
MFTRLLYTLAAAAGLALGSLGVVAAPAAAWGWAALGVFVGVLMAWLRARDAAGGAVFRGIGAGRPAGVRAGGFTFAGGLALIGLSTLLGPATGVVILTLLLLAALLAWRRWCRRDGQPAAEGNRVAGCPDLLPDRCAASTAATTAATTVDTGRAVHPGVVSGLAAQPPHVARPAARPGPLGDRAHPPIPARRTRTTRPRRVHPVARRRRPRQQRTGRYLSDQ